MLKTHYIAMTSIETLHLAIDLADRGDISVEWRENKKNETSNCKHPNGEIDCGPCKKKKRSAS